MSTEGSTNIVVTVEEEKPNFMHKEAKDSEFYPLLKSLKKTSKKAIEVLEAGMDSNDERVRTSCAKSLLDMLLAVTKEHNTDQMQRMIAHCRLIGSGQKTLVPVANSEKDVMKKPVVDFSTIRTLE